jgi:peptidoglycan hydrolase CwlO-like protein
MTKDSKTMTQSKEKIKIFNLNSEIQDLKKKIEYLYFKLDTKDKVIQSLEEKLNLTVSEILFNKPTTSKGE